MKIFNVRYLGDDLRWVKYILGISYHLRRTPLPGLSRCFRMNIG